MYRSEHRRTRRRRTLLDGRVVFNNRYSVIECTVRDLSVSGAKVTFEHPTPLPPTVELEVPKTGQNFRADVIWSDGRSHGLMFVHEPGHTTKVRGSIPQPPNEEAIQAIIAEARRLIVHHAGVPPEAVRLKLEIDY